MSRPGSVRDCCGDSRTEAGRKFAWLQDERGEALASFAIIAPLLVLISAAILEFSLVAFDYHRAGEATRRGARAATLITAIMDKAALPAGGTVTCSAAAGTVSCGGATIAAPASFTTIIAEMQAILPAIKPESVQIEYKDSGLGDPSTPGGILPVITVRLSGLSHPFLLLHGFGFGTGLTYPPFATSLVAGGLGGG